MTVWEPAVTAAVAVAVAVSVLSRKEPVMIEGGSANGKKDWWAWWSRLCIRPAFGSGSRSLAEMVESEGFAL